MKPAAFTYHRPQSLEAALALLAEHGDDAKLIAGGQSLVPMMNFRLVAPEHLVDMAGLPGMEGIEETADGLTVGARVRHADLAESPEAKRVCPLVAAAAETIAHWAIRQRGTVGGSLAHADPAAQLPLIAMTLNARIDIAGPRGTRSVEAPDFFQALMTTALEPEEILTAIRFPAKTAHEGWAFEMRARRAGDFALVAVAATVTVSGDRIEAARLGIGGVGDVPVCPPPALEALIGQPARPETVAAAAVAARDAVDPMEDPLVPAAYRRELVEALTRRALTTALDRSREA